MRTHASGAVIDTSIFVDKSDDESEDGKSIDVESSKQVQHEEKVEKELNQEDDKNEADCFNSNSNDASDDDSCESYDVNISYIFAFYRCTPI